MARLTRFKGEYPANQREINRAAKEAAGWKCERCGRAHNPAAGYALTVHHLDGDKSNNAPWNLAVLCQRCHLTIQGKVFMPQFYMFEHTAWFIPHLKGYYESIGIQFWSLPNDDGLGTVYAYRVPGGPPTSGNGPATGPGRSGHPHHD